MSNLARDIDELLKASDCENCIRKDDRGKCGLECMDHDKLRSVMQSLKGVGELLGNES